MLGLERTSSTIYQTRGPAWREAIDSNLIFMQRPLSSGFCGSFYADCNLRLEPFGPAGVVWRERSHVLPLQSCEICPEVEDPTFRSHLMEQRRPRYWQI
jgi:hypothetical protein